MHASRLLWVLAAAACGESQVEPMGPFDSDTVEQDIVRGIPTTIESVPWQVAIGFQTDAGIFTYCGGSILSAEWVLTANHCEVLAGDKVIAGATAVSDFARLGQVRTVRRVVAKPGFDADRIESGNDVALVKIAPPLVLGGPKAQAIAFARPGDEAVYAPGTLTVVSGWGTFKSGGPSPNIVRETEVSIVSQTDATARFTKARVFFDGGLSADQFGTLGRRTDSCQGDSGGPVVARRNSSPVLVGIVSWGIKCAYRDMPGMNTKVLSHSAFIEQTMNAP